jgi:hypothetical protein
MRALPHTNALTRKDFVATSVPWPKVDAPRISYRFRSGFPPQGVEIALTETRLSDFGRPSAE